MTFCLGSSRAFNGSLSWALHFMPQLLYEYGTYQGILHSVWVGKMPIISLTYSLTWVDKIIGNLHTVQGLVGSARL